MPFETFGGEDAFLACFHSTCTCQASKHAHLLCIEKADGICGECEKRSAVCLAAAASCGRREREGEREGEICPELTEFNKFSVKQMFSSHQVSTHWREGGKERKSFGEAISSPTAFSLAAFPSLSASFRLLLSRNHMPTTKMAANKVI